MRRGYRAAWFGLVAALLPGDSIHDVAPSTAPFRERQATVDRVAQIDTANAKRARKMAKRLRQAKGA